MQYRFWEWITDEEGMATVEYAMLLAMIVVATIGAWVGLGAKIKVAVATATNSISQPLG